MAVGSPFLTGLDLDKYGLSWRWPEIDCAHPLDGGEAGLLYRSAEDTAAGLGRDGARWRLAFGRPSADYGKLAGKIETGTRVTIASQLPAADVTLFDLAPPAVADLLGDTLPGRVARAFRRFRRAPGAFKVDFAVEGGVPWLNPDAGRAGTVHLGGSYAEIATTEREINTGRMPERPYVLVGQQYLADPQRSAGNIHPVYSYAHVPHGYDGDATEAIIAQIERFAPGFRDRIAGQASHGPACFAAANPNFEGGDIITGAKDVRQPVFGPAPPCRPTTSASRACTSAQPRRHPDPACTECAARTPPRKRSATSTASKASARYAPTWIAETSG